MAGIQLTGADEPPSRRDMSGAMPTATVEEIDVPVFIDGEYCVLCVCCLCTQHSLITVALKIKKISKKANKFTISWRKSQIAGIEHGPGSQGSGSVALPRTSRYSHHVADEGEDHSAMTH